VFAQRARLESHAGHQQEAESLFRRGLTLAPTHLDLHTAFASMLEDMGRIPEALAVLAELNDHTSGIDWIMVWLARLHLEAGDAESALELLDSRPGLTERIAMTSLVRGHSLRRLGRHAEAEEALRHAEAFAPQPDA
jgi:tetratricopeptide (TPR) repeat protein